MVTNRLTSAFVGEYRSKVPLIPIPILPLSISSKAKNFLSSVAGKSKYLLGASVALGTSAASAAVETPYAGTLVDAFSGSTANRQAVDGLTNTGFSMITSMIYTVAKFLVEFFSQPTVLAVVVGIAVIYMIAMAVVKRMKRGAGIGR